MGYRLKSGLSKTAVYQSLVDHMPSEIELPSMWQCRFRHYRNSYWLNFVSNGKSYEVYMTMCCGQVQFFIDQNFYDEVDCCTSKRVASFSLPFDYLLERKMLREVA